MNTTTETPKPKPEKGRMVTVYSPTKPGKPFTAKKIRPNDKCTCKSGLKQKKLLWS